MNQACKALRCYLTYSTPVLMAISICNILVVVIYQSLLHWLSICGRNFGTSVSSDVTNLLMAASDFLSIIPQPDTLFSVVNEILLVTFIYESGHKHMYLRKKSKFKCRGYPNHQKHKIHSVVLLLSCPFKWI